MAGKHASKNPHGDNMSSSRTKIGKHMTDDRKKEIRAEQQEKTWKDKNPKKEPGPVGPKTKAFIEPKPDNYGPNSDSAIQPKSPADRANDSARKPGM
jgi:hypothetical protein